MNRQFRVLDLFFGIVLAALSVKCCLLELDNQRLVRFTRSDYKAIQQHENQLLLHKNNHLTNRTRVDSIIETVDYNTEVFEDELDEIQCELDALWENRRGN